MTTETKISRILDAEVELTITSEVAKRPDFIACE